MSVDQARDGHQVSLTPTRVRQPRDFWEWLLWFNKFCAIYTSKYYKAAPQLFAYVNQIMGLHRRDPKVGLWRNYDEEFRCIKACCPGLPWHLLQPQILAEVQVVMVVSSKIVTKMKITRNSHLMALVTHGIEEIARRQAANTHTCVHIAKGIIGRQDIRQSPND